MKPAAVLVAVALAATACTAPSSTGSSTPTAVPTVAVAPIVDPTAAVTVTDLYGNPVAGARVGIAGTNSFAETAATGVARLAVPRGAIYTLVAAKDGYMNTGARVTVPSSGDPPPALIQMPFAPPIGPSVMRPRSTIWLVLTAVPSGGDFILEAVEVEWHCWYREWSSRNVEAILGRNEVRIGSYRLALLGPGRIELMERSTKGPNTSAPPPPGTCS